MVIVLCFSLADSSAKKAIRSQLAPLLSNRARKTSLLCLDDAPAGVSIRTFQQEAIAQADVALLVISAALLADASLDGVRELLRHRRLESSLRVIPVIWQACLWEETEWLRGLVPVPADGTALATVDRPRREQELLTMVQQLSEDRRSQLRKKLDRVLTSPAELQRFCADYLPAGVAPIQGAFDLARMLDQLLAKVEPDRIEHALAVAFPDRTAQPGRPQGAVLCATLRLIARASGARC